MGNAFDRLTVGARLGAAVGRWLGASLPTDADTWMHDYPSPLELVMLYQDLASAIQAADEATSPHIARCPLLEHDADGRPLTEVLLHSYGLPAASPLG